MQSTAPFTKKSFIFKELQPLGPWKGDRFQ